MTHEVYIARNKKDEVVYVGSGKTGRNVHVNSGVSNCYELNRLHFNGEDCDVEIIPCENKESSEMLERSLVMDHLPRGNRNLFLKYLNNPVVSHTVSLMKEINDYIKEKMSEGVEIRLKRTIPPLLAMRYNSFKDTCRISRDIVKAGYGNYLIVDHITRRNHGIKPLFSAITSGIRNSKSDFIFIEQVSLVDDNTIEFTYNRDLFLKTSRRNFVEENNY